jgi:hypothetical protein
MKRSRTDGVKTKEGKGSRPRNPTGKNKERNGCISRGPRVIKTDNNGHVIVSSEQLMKRRKYLASPLPYHGQSEVYQS